VPPNMWVLRVGKDVAVSELASLPCSPAPIRMFVLSTADKTSDRAHLSVFVEELTVADQAWAILGSKPNYTVVACASVVMINSVSVTRPDNAIVEQLDVQWEPPSNQTDPGAEGHCGIFNVYHPSSKTLERALRSKLADQFRLSPVPVPHNFSDDEVQQTVNLFDCDPDENSELRLTMAIRELRRRRSAAIRKMQDS